MCSREDDDMDYDKDDDRDDDTDDDTDDDRDDDRDEGAAHLYAPLFLQVRVIPQQLVHP